MSEQKETKNCPFCGEEILAVAIKCKHCLEMLNIPPKDGNESDIQVVDNLSKSQKYLCPTCLDIIPADAIGCFKCGANSSEDKDWRPVQLESENIASTTAMHENVLKEAFSCPRCGAVVDSESKECFNCFCTVNVDKLGGVDELGGWLLIEKPLVNNFKRCEKCNKEIPENAINCPHCGCKFTSAASATADAVAAFARGTGNLIQRTIDGPWETFSKIVGALLVITGFLVSLSGIGVLIGLPMIITGLICFFSPVFAIIVLFGWYLFFDLIKTIVNHFI